MIVICVSAIIFILLLMYGILAIIDAISMPEFGFVNTNEENINNISFDKYISVFRKYN